MGLFSFFERNALERNEKAGDRHLLEGRWGPAKLAYEKALAASIRRPESAGGDDRPRLQAKLDRCCAALAREHTAAARDLLSAGCYTEAAELLHLARDLDSAAAARLEIDALLTAAETAAGEAIGPPPGEADFPPDEDGEYLEVLYGMLPPALQAIYTAYGETFADGYAALHRGDFEHAAHCLAAAAEAHGPDPGYIDLELATAYLNLGEAERAERHLTRFVEHDPHNERAYELLCDLFWSKGAFDKAQALLAACPAELKASDRMILLAGETLLQAGRLAEAAAHYRQYLQIAGPNTVFMTALARTLEAAGDAEEARRLYAAILDQCRGCGAAVDPFVKQRYALLGYAAGDLSDHVLELLLALCREDDDNRGRYYDMVATIYARRGHPQEAARYRSFATELARQAPPPGANEKTGGHAQ